MAVDQTGFRKSVLVDAIVAAKYPADFVQTMKSAAFASISSRANYRGMETARGALDRYEKYRQEIEAKPLEELMEIFKRQLHVSIEDAAVRLAVAVMPDIPGYPAAVEGRAELARRYCEVVATLAFNGVIAYINPHDLKPFDHARFSDAFFPLDGLVHLNDLRRCLLPEHARYADSLPKKPVPVSKASAPIKPLGGGTYRPPPAKPQLQPAMPTAAPSQAVPPALSFPDAPAGISEPQGNPALIPVVADTPAFPTAPVQSESRIKELAYPGATPEQLSAAFGFDKKLCTEQRGKVPGLDEARVDDGESGPNGCPPLFDPYMVMLWHIDRRKNRNKPLIAREAWAALEKHFPEAYAQHETYDDRL